MNVQFRLPSKMTGLAVAHAITAYDSISSELVSEFEIPLGLDSLAVKIAEVDEDDPFGALSYPLGERQLVALRFIFGLQSSLTNAEFFFEPWERQEEYKNLKTANLFAKLKEVSFNEAIRRHSTSINERELTVPTLRLLSESPTGFLTTTELKSRLTEKLRPTGSDAELLASRSDTHFAQKVRNMVSNRWRPYSFINKGYAIYNEEKHGLRITEAGREVLRQLDWYGRQRRH